MEEKRPFGDYIRRKRQEAGLTQRELVGAGAFLSRRAHHYLDL